MTYPPEGRSTYIQSLAEKYRRRIGLCALHSGASWAVDGDCGPLCAAQSRLPDTRDHAVAAYVEASIAETQETIRTISQSLVTRLQLSEPGDNAGELVRQLVALAAELSTATPEALGPDEHIAWDEDAIATAQGIMRELLQVPSSLGESIRYPRKLSSGGVS